MKQSALKRTSSLKAKLPLNARKGLSRASSSTKRKKPRKLEQKTASQLRNGPVWKVFSRYVRIRDSERRGDEWHGKCITCSKQGVVAHIDSAGKLRFVAGWDAGHFISRGNNYLFIDEENVNLQCSFHCNRMKSGNIERYKPALDDKYGSGTWRKLEELAQEHRVHPLRKADMLQAYREYSDMLAFMTK